MTRNNKLDELLVVTLSNKEQLADVKVQLGEVKASIDGLAETIHGAKDQPGLKGRLDRLEQSQKTWRVVQAGLSTLMMAIAAALGMRK